MSADDIIEITELDMGDLDSGLNISSSASSFGGGIELLMNDKMKESSGSKKMNDIDITDLNSLEAELNNLSDVDNNIDTNSSNKFEPRSSLFNKTEDKPFVRFTDSPNTTSSNIGKDTADGASEKTWDGFNKFNNVPINPDTSSAQAQPQMSKEELLREKFKFLRKLEALETKGVNLTKKYTMESPLAEMQGEYEMIMEEKHRLNSVKFSGNMMMACVNGIEFLNNRFDPFDVKLDGWSDQVNENLGDYDDVFAELYDKYKSKASMAPELKLVFQLGKCNDGSHDEYIIQNRYAWNG